MTVALTLLACAAAHAAPSIATAGGAVRDAKNAIDVDATLDALGRLGATEYLYDLPADSEAWARLPAFADAAAKRKISVDVYLAPWSQARKGGKQRQDGPFGVDYVAWCGAIADLAKDHPAIRGVVMDDFGANVGPERFTPELVAAMHRRLGSGDRRLIFRPVLYFDEPLDALLDTYGRFFSGAILCYPRSPREVEVALNVMRDGPRGAQLFTELPKKHKLHRGQGTFAMARLTREQARDARRLTFYADDFDHGDKAGRHELVARVDGREVWRRKLKGRGGDDISIDLPPRLRDGATLELGVVVDEPAAEEVEVRISFDDVTLRDGRGKPIDVRWADDVDDGIRFDVAQASRGGVRQQTAMTLLVAGAPFAHEKIFNEPPTPDAIAGKFAEALSWCRDGKGDGVISWALPLEDRKIVDATRKAVDRDAK